MALTDLTLTDALIKLRKREISAVELTQAHLDRIAEVRAIFESNALQRQFRDVHAAAAHASLVWDSGMAEYGRHLLGQDRG